MAHIKIRKGLNLPLSGTPNEGPIRTFECSEAALDFSPFSTIRPHVLVKVGDHVAIGQPIVEEKGGGSRVWTAPATGVVKEICRGEKRVLQSIVISKEGDERYPIAEMNDPMEFLRKTGLLSHLWMRPFCLPAHPHLKPRSIFVKAIESAPFAPSAEMQLEGNERFFEVGLEFLSKLAKVHIVHGKGSPFERFGSALHHTAEGPHPVSHPSLHIQSIDPILKSTDVLWTIDTCGVIAIGRAIEKGVLHGERVVAIAGDGIAPEYRGYYRMSEGASLDSIPKTSQLISGDPLTGSIQPFLGFGHTVVCAIAEAVERKPFHFFRWKSPSFTATRTYRQNQTVSNRLHGEERAFLDPNIYDKVMPLHIPTVPLVKAILAEDFEAAEELGLLEVAPEDFALATFICPSKIEMVEIVRRGLQKMAAENLSS